MKPIINIARAELRHLFFSPVAWFVLILFFMLSSSLVLGILEQMAISQQTSIDLSGDKFRGFLNTPLTAVLAATNLGKIVQLLFLVIPMLTMGAMNREYAGGTIRLIHSSPVSTRQFVLGKFLGIYSFTILTVAIYAVIVLVLNFSISNVDSLHLLAILLGLLFVCALFVSIGLFISSLTKYPIVAAIGTFVSLVIISTLGGALQQYDYVRDITYFLSSEGRAKTIMFGLLNTRDLMYLVCMPAMFVVFTIIKAKSVTESKSWKVSAGRYLAVLSITVLLLLATSIHGYIGYWDVTNSKRNTIHENTQHVIGKLDGSPLKVTLYTNLLGYGASYGFPVSRNNFLWGYWARYQRFYPNIEFDFVYYYDVRDNDSLIYRKFPGKTLDEIAEKMAELNNVDYADFLKPAEIRTKIDFGAESLGLNMKLDYKGKTAWLRFYDDAIVFPFEKHLSGSILRLVSDTTPAFKFLTGHYERDAFKMGRREYGLHTSSIKSRIGLINMGVDIDSLQEISPAAFLPQEILVIADPKTVLESSLVDSVKNYLDQGGNAIFYTEPGKQFIMNPILNHIGVQAESGILVKESKHEMPHVFHPTVTVEGAEMSDETELFQFKNKLRDTCEVSSIGAANLSFSDSAGFKVEPVLAINNNSKTWVENGHLVVDSAAPIFRTEEGDVRSDKPYTVALKLSRNINGKEQRIIVCSDGDIMTPSEGYGAEMGLSFYAYTMQNERPVYHNNKVPNDIWVLVGKNTAKVIKNTFVLIIPAFILVAGIIVLVRRKRK